MEFDTVRLDGLFCPTSEANLLTVTALPSGKKQRTQRLFRQCNKGSMLGGRVEATEHSSLNALF